MPFVATKIDTFDCEKQSLVLTEEHIISETTTVCFFLKTLQDFCLWMETGNVMCSGYANPFPGRLCLFRSQASQMNQRAAQAAQVAQDEVRGHLLSGLRNDTVTLFCFSQKN